MHHTGRPTKLPAVVMTETPEGQLSKPFTVDELATVGEGSMLNYIEKLVDMAKGKNRIVVPNHYFREFDIDVLRFSNSLATLREATGLDIRTISIVPDGVLVKYNRSYSGR
jgi:hypothetical protein